MTIQIYVYHLMAMSMSNVTYHVEYLKGQTNGTKASCHLEW